VWTSPRIEEVDAGKPRNSALDGLAALTASAAARDRSPVARLAWLVASASSARAQTIPAASKRAKR
jgi:hypothetical protein